MLRKTLCRLLCCIAILCLTAASLTASGAEAEIRGSLSFDFSAADPAVTDGALELRQVAVWDESMTALTWCGDFGGAGLDAKDLVELDDAWVLYAYAQELGIPAETVSIEAGLGLAADLERGVYLVSQSVPFEGYRCVSPALIFVPYRPTSYSELIYDVEAVPKLEPLEDEPPTEPTPPPPPPDLPPTGQINWPIPVLTLGGVALVILGFLLRREKRHERTD